MQNSKEIAAEKRNIARMMIMNGETNGKIHSVLKDKYNGTITTKVISDMRRELNKPSPGMNSGLKKAMQKRWAHKPKKKQKTKATKKRRKPPITDDDVLVITGNKCSADVEAVLNDMIGIFRNEGFIAVHIDVSNGEIHITKEQEIHLSFGG